MAINPPIVDAGPTIKRRHVLTQPVTVGVETPGVDLAGPAYEGQVYFEYTFEENLRLYGMYVAVNTSTFDTSDQDIIDGGNFTANTTTTGSTLSFDGGDLTTGATAASSDDFIDGGNFSVSVNPTLEWKPVALGEFRDRYTGLPVDPLYFGRGTAEYPF